MGAKARKGWGSLSLTPEVPPWKALRETGVDITQKSDLVRRLDWGETAQWGRDIREHCVEVKTQWNDAWFALDQIGFIYQGFAKGFAHDERKGALGLPRKIHGPKDRPIKIVQDPRTHQRPLWLGDEHPYRPRATKAQDFRHAAPIQIHLSRRKDGCFTVRVTVFPNSVLPDPQTSTKILGKFLKHFKRNLK